MPDWDRINADMKLIHDKNYRFKIVDNGENILDITTKRKYKGMKEITNLLNLLNRELSE